jgi:outer membrane protein assembly factor BamD
MSLNHTITTFSLRFTQHAAKIALGILLPCLLILSGCGQKAYVDPLQKFRHMTAEQLFNSANADLARGHDGEAAAQYAALDAMYPFGKYNKQAQRNIIYAYYKSNDMLSTSMAAERYIRLYPRGKHTDYAFYMNALANFDQGQTWVSKHIGATASERDFQYFNTAYHNLLNLTQAYPNSAYYHDAVLRIHYLRNLQAKQNYIIAQYYFKRKAYVAVINRCNIILKNIPGSSYAPQALQLMINAYNELGLPKQAAYYDTISKRSFG